MSPSPEPRSLVADIGGTNTRVGMAAGTRIDANSVRRFRNAEHKDLESVLRLYLSEMQIESCEAACVAVAGPVRDGVGSLTNLDWTLDAERLGAATGASQSALVNDLQAQGYALAGLPDQQLQSVLAKATPSQSPLPQSRLVVGVGTGFNAAPVVPVTYAGQDKVVVPASECGHMGLPQRSSEDRALYDELSAQLGFVSVEDVLSGRGLERVFAYHAARAGASPLPAAQVMMALGQEDPVAQDAAQDFMRILGMVVGGLALTHLPFGGIYLVGGVARAFGPYLQNGPFAQAFADKGRFAELMQNFQVFLVLDDYAALTGAAAYLNLSKKT